MKKIWTCAAAGFLILVTSVCCLTSCGTKEFPYTPLGSEDQLTGNWVWSDDSEVQVTFDGSQYFEFEGGSHLWNGNYTFDGTTVSGQVTEGSADYPTFSAALNADGEMVFEGYGGSFRNRGKRGLRCEEDSFIVNTWTDPVSGNFFVFTEEDVESTIDNKNSGGEYYFDGTNLILDFTLEDYTGYFDDDGDLIINEMEGCWFSAPGNTTKWEIYEEESEEIHRKEEEIQAQIIGIWRNETVSQDLEIHPNGECLMYANSTDADTINFSFGYYTYDGEKLQLDFYDDLEGNLDEDGQLIIPEYEGVFVRIQDDIEEQSDTIPPELVGIWENKLSKRTLKIYQDGKCKLYSYNLGANDLSFSIGSCTYMNDQLTMNFADDLTASINENGSIVIPEYYGTFIRVSEDPDKK